MTRLLNTAMKGTATETVASSWMEALGGVSMCSIFRIPPDFWAKLGNATTLNAAATAARPIRAVIVSSLIDAGLDLPHAKDAQ